MPDQFEQYYKYLKSNGADVAPDFNSFKNTLSNADASSKYYTYLKDNKFDVPETYDSFADTFGLKKKGGTTVSGPTPSKLPSQDYLREGEKMAAVGFATPQLLSEDVKARKEPKIRISPKLFAAPGVVDVDIIEEDEDGSYKNLAQNLANNFLISASDIGAGLAQILREGAPTGVPITEKKKTEELYTPEGEKTKYAQTVTWAKDPLAKVALGLNGIAQPARELQETPSANLPDTFVGNTLTSLSAIVPDLAATALLPEAKAIQGASFLQKTGSLLFNNFTKYLMVKEPLVDYNKSKLEGKDQSALDVLSNVGKGALSGMELALLGAGSGLATKATMKQAAKTGLVGTKGFVAKELVNLATDVVAYGLISPSAHTLYEEGRLPTSKEISEGAGIALAFRLKDVIPSISTFRDLNKAVDNIQQAKQGAAIYNFLQATPESIVSVYNGKESANDLHLKAMEAAKAAREAVDPIEKQKAVIQASTMAKAANVKQVAEMFVQDKQLVDYVKNSDLPEEAKIAILEKAEAIRKAVDPVEIKKEQTGQRMQQSQAFIQDLTLEMNGEQDPVKKAELQFRINETEKGLKMQENELMSLIEGQAKEAPLDLTDINTVKQSRKSFNEQVNLKLESLDKADPDYFEKVESLNKQREERNDYFDRVLEDKKQEEKSISVMTPEEFNQVENIEISLEGQKTEAPVEEVITEVKPIEAKTEVIESGNDLILSHGTRHDFNKFQLEKIGTGEGAQAFGYGLYFTDGSKIAEGYAKKLSEDNTGLVYSVKIKNGKLANWAEWRRPLEESIESTFYDKLTKEEKAQYQDYVDNQFNSGKDKNYTGSFGDLELSKEGFLEYPTFEKPSASGNLYQDLKDAFGQEKATEIFKRAGIDGIKYESQGGYGNENNYVVFNPESIEIIKKSKGGEKVKPTEVKPKIIEAPEQKLDQDNRTYTTKSGRQKVDYEKGQLIVRDIKTGEEVSPATRRKAIDEYIDNFDFSKGKTAEEKGVEFEGLSNLDVIKKGIDESENPIELASTYLAEEPIGKFKSSNEELIALYGIGKVKESSFNSFSDRNYKTGGMALTYFNKKGQTLDVIAKSMSDHYKIEITPKDVADFMIAHPSGESSALRSLDGPIAARAAERFKELTGLDLDAKLAEKALIKGEQKLNQDQLDIIKQDYDTTKQLEDDYWKAYKETDGFTKKGPSGEIKPTEAATKETLAQDYKDLTRIEKRKIINSKFDELLKELKIEKICP